MFLHSLKSLCAGLSLLACSSAFAGPLTIDVGGIDSVGALGTAGNTVLNYKVGAHSTVTGISFAVDLSSYGTSWLSEIALQFSDSTGANGIHFTPAVSENMAGTASIIGAASLADYGLVFDVGADGILRLEFYENFDDFAGADGRWNAGTITFEIDGFDAAAPVPEPASTLLIAGGLAALAYGRRRRAAKAGRLIG